MIEETPEVVGLNKIGDAKVSTPSAPKRAWLPSDTGYHGKVIEYEGEKFYPQQVQKSALRQFSDSNRRLPREIKALEKQQADELKALQTETPTAELSDDRLEWYDAQSERITEELDAAYDKVLAAGLVGWSLPHSFNSENLKQLDKTDKLALCMELASRAMSGFSTIKNS